MSASSKIKVLSMDPGLSYTGWANSIYYPDNNDEILVQRYSHIAPAQIARKNKDKLLNETMMGHFKAKEHSVVRSTTLCVIEQEVMKLVDSFKPDHVVCEAPFYNPRRPNAYAALIMWMTTVMSALHRNYQMPLISLAPMHIKQTVAGRGNCGKDEVAKGIFKYPNLRFKNKSINENTVFVDHESDAIAVGITFLHHAYIMKK